MRQETDPEKGAREAKEKAIRLERQQRAIPYGMDASNKLAKP